MALAQINIRDVTLCSTNQEKTFFDLWQKLDDLTKKASEEIAKKPVSTEPGE
jgi:hypothetical protein